MTLLFGSSGLIAWGGVFIIALLIFAETGLLLGLIIPGGETLIFTSGILVSSGGLHINIYLLLLILIVAGYCGDCSGYYVGKRFGPKLYNKKDTWYFRKKYLQMAEEFFKKHKRTAVLFGKFLPVIRPFSPLMSGMIHLKRSSFLLLSLLSVILYMSGFLFAGYFLGNQFPQIKNYLGWILPISILILLIPVYMQVKKNKVQTP